MSKRTYPSGSQKRIRATETKRKAIENVKKLDSYFATSASTSSDMNSGSAFPEAESERKEEDEPAAVSPGSLNPLLSEPVKDTEPDQQTSDNYSRKTLNTLGFQIDNPYPSDRGLYPTTIVDHDLRDVIAKHGPCKPNGPFPTKTGTTRKFSASRYKMCNKAGIEIELRWLCYSPTLDCAYCHPCWLFADRLSKSFHLEWIEGISDWGHLSQKIKIHKDSADHVRAVISEKLWLDKRGHIDKELEKQLLEESNYWFNVLQLFVDIIFTLASCNLAFRGHREDVNSVGSGNFLSLVQLLARYDPVLKELMLKPEGSVRYLSPKIQNELISLLASKLREHLLSEIRAAPFFAIIGDTTIDISKTDQYSNCIRYVYLDSGAKTVEVRETFIDFYALRDQSAEGFVNLITGFLTECNIDINKCRGQGYDGASVMSGAYSGVQQRIQRLVPNAVYVHCVCHRLNLVLGDAAESCAEMKSFFSIVQAIYVFFGGSAPRWALLRAFSSDQEKQISLKSLCTTRWESRHSSVMAIITRFPDIVRTLTHLTLAGDRPALRNEAGKMLENMSKMDFVLPLILWEKILRFVRAVSKLLQSKNVDLSLATDLLGTAMHNLTSLRNQFQELCQEARSFGAKWGVDVQFENKRKRTVKRLFDELASDERLDTVEGRFRISVYLPTVDICLNQMKNRFESLQHVVTNFKFLFPKILAVSTDEELSNMVTVFVERYKDDVSDDLLSQVLAFRACAQEYIAKAQKNNNVKELMDILLQLDLLSSFPDLVTAIAIFLTLPVSVTSDERSFSKLKLIKTYLRSTMTQERLGDLGVLSIEKERFKEINRNDIVRDFANAKARKRTF